MREEDSWRGDEKEKFERVRERNKRLRGRQFEQSKELEGDSLLNQLGRGL